MAGLFSQVEHQLVREDQAKLRFSQRVETTILQPPSALGQPAQYRVVVCPVFCMARP